MPPLRDPRKERYAIFLARGDSQIEAYRRAGYKADGTNAKANASRAARMPIIAERIAELKGGEADRLGVTVEILLTEIEEARQQALKNKNPAAATAATLAKAKLLGLSNDSRADDKPDTVRKPMNAPGEYGEMSLKEWQDRFAPKSEASS